MAGQPPLPLVYRPDADVERLRARFFPEVTVPVGVRITGKGPLASIRAGSARVDPIIYFHSVVAGPDVPGWVREFLIKHELLHLVVESRSVRGRLRSHPPEFWERERTLCPERERAWAWLWANLGSCLKRRPILEGVWVTREWKAVRAEKVRRFSPG